MRAQRRRQADIDRSGSFLPTQLSSVKKWYRLAASTAVAGEYESVNEVLGGTALSQTSANRKPATATSSNSLPVAEFDGSDMWMQTLESGNNGTSKWWILFTVKPANFGALQRIYNNTLGGLGGSSSANRMRISLTATTGRVSVDIFVSGSNGRNYVATSAGITAGSFNTVYVQFDSTKTSEADLDGSTSDAKLRIALGTTFVALTASDIGTGGAVTGLLAATGTAEIGAASNSDTPTSPFLNGGQFGPNLYNGDEPLTAAELTNLTQFEMPT